MRTGREADRESRRQPDRSGRGSRQGPSFQKIFGA
jgi:hypothetical protein